MRYKRYQTLSPIYGGGLTNHLPMVLTIYNLLDLDEETIIAKLEAYIEERGIYDMTKPYAPRSEFDQAYINRTSFYLSELNHVGKDIVVGTFLAEKRASIFSALFHGLIRLYYALIEKDDMQIAQALAYFELSSESIKIETKATLDYPSFNQEFEMLLSQFHELNYEFKATSTMEKAKEILQLPLINQRLNTVRNITKEQVLQFITNHYIISPDFFTLHLITGFHALVELEEFIYDFEDVLKEFLKLAQVIMMLRYQKSESELFSTISINECLNHVESLSDFHEVKLLYSVYRLAQLFDDENLIKIANKVIKNRV